ncbi:MAG: YjbQ family protein [Bryobacterales bacterium]|nr:YjbQ family protein [Bryobacterales bacterium]
MKQFTHRFEIRTDGKGLYNVTREIERWVRECGLTTGLLTVWLQHTSASLTVQENADPDVVLDMADFFQKLVPDNPRLYRHTIEGPDDMPAHIRAALTMTQLSIPLMDGELALGTWQGIYVFEHRVMSHRRSVILHLLGE